MLIGGTAYAGEIKKSVFTMMNYLLPQPDVLSAHCAANASDDGDVALFFGLSGTGKTTLSTDPIRRMIGDDELGWSERGVFNHEGGSYAKVIRLSPVARVVKDGMGKHPRDLFLLTADAFGVLPPLARLDADHAVYHFLLGYTAKVAGTETGVVEPRATFSPCFGAPFMALSPSVYANLLAERIARHQPRVWLVNTGWTGVHTGLVGGCRSATRARCCPPRWPGRSIESRRASSRGSGLLSRERARTCRARSSIRARRGPMAPRTIARPKGLHRCSWKHSPRWASRSHPRCARQGLAPRKAS